MSWVDAVYRAAEADPLVSAAAGIIAHMNEDHSDAQVLCRHFAGLDDTVETGCTPPAVRSQAAGSQCVRSA
jgi:hypothetical protein